MSLNWAIKKSIDLVCTATYRCLFCFHFPKTKLTEAVKLAPHSSDKCQIVPHRDNIVLNCDTIVLNRDTIVLNCDNSAQLIVLNTSLNIIA